MKRAIIVLCATLCALSGAFAQSFPVSGGLIYSPKARTSIACATVEVGKTAPIVLGKLSIQPTLFTYAGLDLNTSNGAAGIGAKMQLTPKNSGIALEGGLTYGTVKTQQSHVGLFVMFKINMAKDSPPASAETHQFSIK